MPENAQIDDDLFDKINEAMLIRLKDKIPNVRIQVLTRDEFRLAVSSSCCIDFPTMLCCKTGIVSKHTLSSKLLLSR